MRRLKPVFMVCWAALWLVGAMHCPMEALGLLPNDFCCCTSPSALADSNGPAKSGCSHEASALQLGTRPGETPPLLLPATLVEPGFPVLMRPTALLVIKLANPANAPAWRSQNWQFRWRTALAPRAPSPLA
ncbi:MAG: hypothetical protein WCO56_05330 [Verrucomicrobiota bacterium]